MKEAFLKKFAKLGKDRLIINKDDQFISNGNTAIKFDEEKFGLVVKLFEIIGSTSKKISTQEFTHPLSTVLHPTGDVEKLDPSEAFIDKNFGTCVRSGAERGVRMDSIDIVEKMLGISDTLFDGSWKISECGNQAQLSAGEEVVAVIMAVLEDS